MLFRRLTLDAVLDHPRVLHHLLKGEPIFRIDDE
jgi:hypothetical protein